MEIPQGIIEDRFTRGSAILRSLVRRLSGSESSGASRRVIGGSGGARFRGTGKDPQPGVGAGSTTVSASGAPSGHGSLSRRPSRELSPSKVPGSTPGHDGPGGGGAESPTASGGSQDWRRLVGSIRRKVNRKTAQGSSNISAAALQDTNRNHDDFLKATMRIFLVVSPPMGRVQVIHPVLPFLGLFLLIIEPWY